MSRARVSHSLEQATRFYDALRKRQATQSARAMPSQLLLLPLANHAFDLTNSPRAGALSHCPRSESLFLTLTLRDAFVRRSAHQSLRTSLAARTARGRVVDVCKVKNLCSCL